jgi:hypothetical protein
MPWRDLGWAIGVVAALLLFYVGSYYSLVAPQQPHGLARLDSVILLDDPPPRPPIGPAGIIHLRCRLKPRYAIGDSILAPVFRPIHELDVNVRHGLWHSTIEEFRFAGPVFQSTNP